MAESTNSLPDMEERSIEETPLHLTRETHGLNSGIDENTPLDEVKAPNLFERAKEEFEAIAQVFHHKKEASIHDASNENQMGGSKHKEQIPSSLSDKNEKEENIFDRAKKEIKAIIHHHHKETHGTSDNIDENTHVNEVKTPNVLERVKEEVEAVLHAIHPKKET